MPAWNGDPATGFNLIIRRIERHGYLTENVPFHNVNVDEAFRRASTNILSMRFVGFFDRLSDATSSLNREFGLHVGLDKRRNPTPWMPSLKDLPGNVVAMLKRKTEADYEFFSTAERLPTAALSQHIRLWRKVRARFRAKAVRRQKSS